MSSTPLTTSSGLRRRLNESQVGLFTAFALVMLAAVVVIGLVLSLSFRSDANRRGLAEGQSEALLMAETAVGPAMNGQLLSQGLTPSETSEMNLLVATTIKSRHVLLLRLRDLQGAIVFSSKGRRDHDELSRDDQEEVAKVASGTIVARLTTLNADNATGPRGPAAVEVYLPLVASLSGRRVGVLELYLPYAPIRNDVNAGLSRLYHDLALALGLLYVLLVAISLVVGRRLRQQVKLTRHVGEHDLLTELPNRTLFQSQAESELVRARKAGEYTAIAIVDLDRFKEINDTLGHRNGDVLLRSLSSVMRAHLPDANVVARLGGNEFGFALSARTELDTTLEQLRQAIAAEVLIRGIPLSIESSIGYAVSPLDGETLDELLPLAEIAMYTAKEHHLGVTRYGVEQNRFVASDLALMADLRLAIDNDELTLHYQPQISLASGEVHAVEALVRWRHPVEGLIYPDRFIALAEKTDLIDRLTDWVVHQALVDSPHFRSHGNDLRISVNISARNLSKPGFAARVVSALALSEVTPDRLIVEVTETALMTDPLRAAGQLEELSRTGVHLSIDDFGVGQTSLGYLSSLPVSELKIDRSFISDMRSDQSHAAIVRAIIDLGHNLGFRVVGEGVEDAAVLHELSVAGCNVAQGYFFARPMTVEALNEWLAQRHVLSLL
ncbi:MAG: diguanylate cyclase/phosphodiesterase [Acidimicrobiaceae bacterium]|nr:diguanylate cyclase/phosphodiesterase [Acidimicrobiaceae bacterium]